MLPAQQALRRLDRGATPAGLQPRVGAEVDVDSLPATEERRQRIPMQRYGKSQEIAATIAFLASPGAGYITGQNIRVDGGITRAV